MQALGGATDTAGFENRHKDPDQIEVDHGHSKYSLYLYLIEKSIYLIYSDSIHIVWKHKRSSPALLRKTSGQRTAKSRCHGHDNNKSNVYALN
jgi:hypothetical protein